MKLKPKAYLKKQQTTLNGKGYLPKCVNGIGGWQ
jgi:hypothetical protein